MEPQPYRRAAILAAAGSILQARGVFPGRRKCSRLRRPGWPRTDASGEILEARRTLTYSITDEHGFAIAELR